jgi:putative MFS transporter
MQSLGATVDVAARAPRGCQQFPASSGSSAGAEPRGATSSRELAIALDRIGFQRVHVVILALVAFGTLINAIEEYNVGLAGPLIAREWSLSDAQVDLLTTLTFGGMAIGSVAAGVLADRYGRRTPYIYNLALYTVGALLAAFSPGFGWLIAARFVVGIGLGGELNTGLTLVAELMPTRYRGAAVATVNVAGGGLGIFASSALAALMLGPLEATLGGPTVAWRWLLGVLALPAALIFIYRRFLPESPRHLVVEGRGQEANEVLARLSSNRLRRTRTGHPIRRVGQVRRTRARLSDVFQGRLRRSTAVIWVVCAMTFGAQVTVTVFMPTFLVSRGLNVSTSLAYTMIINAGGLVGAVLASALSHMFRRRAVLGYGCVFAVAAAIGLANASSLMAVVVCGALLQLAFLLLNTTTFVWAPELYPTRLRAFGTGTSVTVLLVSASFVPLLAGTIADAVGAVGVFLLVSTMYVVMAVAVWFGPETHGRSLEELSEPPTG